MFNSTIERLCDFARQAKDLETAAVAVLQGRVPGVRRADKIATVLLIQEAWELLLDVFCNHLVDSGTMAITSLKDLMEMSADALDAAVVNLAGSNVWQLARSLSKKITDEKLLAGIRRAQECEMQAIERLLRDASSSVLSRVSLEPHDSKAVVRKLRQFVNQAALYIPASTTLIVSDTAPLGDEKLPAIVAARILSCHARAWALSISTCYSAQLAGGEVTGYQLLQMPDIVLNGAEVRYSGPEVNSQHRKWSEMASLEEVIAGLLLAQSRQMELIEYFLACAKFDSG